MTAFVTAYFSVTDSEGITSSYSTSASQASYGDNRNKISAEALILTRKIIKKQVQDIVSNIKNNNSLRVHGYKEKASYSVTLDIID